MDYRGMSLEEWRPLVREWQESRLSMTSWCKQRQVPFHLFSYWRAKIDVTGLQVPLKGAFVPVKDDMKLPETVSIFYGDYRIQIELPVNEELVIQCLRMMRRAL